MTSKTLFLHKILPVLLIVATGIGLYGQTLTYPFHVGDQAGIVQNPSIRNLADREALVRLASSPSRFIPFLTFALNYAVHQLDVTGYHIVNIAIHVINALLVWLFVLLIFKTPKLQQDESFEQRYWIAFFSAMIFLTHPVQTQAVTYIIHRTTSLAAFFYLMTLCLYLHGRLKPRGGWLVFFLSMATALCGMFTHPVTITLPLMIILIEFVFLRPGKTLPGARKDFHFHHMVLVFCFTLIIPFLYRFQYEGILSRKLISHSHDLHEEIITGWSYFITQPRVLMTYLKVLIFPVHLNVDYDFRLTSSMLDGYFLLSITVILMMAIAAVRSYNRSVLFFLGICWAFLTSCVESSIIPQPNVIFEHRLYLPMAGIALGCVAGLFNLSKRYMANRIVLVFVVCLLGFLTAGRNAVYKSGIELWSDAVHKSPTKLRAYNNLGLAYLEAGDIQQASTHFERAVSLNPRYAKAYHGLVLINRLQGDHRRAADNIEKALALQPDNPLFLNTRGEIFFEQGEVDRALADFKKAIGHNRTYAEAYNNEGQVYRLKGDWLMAMADFNRAIGINPYFAQAYNNRGLVYRSEKKYKDALENFNEAIKINPDYAAAFNNRGLIHKDQKEYDAALKDFNRVIEIDLRQEKVYNNRGLIYEKIGQDQMALKDYSQAISLNPSYVAAYTNRGFLHLRKKQYDLAFVDFDKAVAINPKPAMSLYHRSQAFFEVGKYAEAMKDLRRAQQLGLKPDKAYVQKLEDAVLPVPKE